MDIKNILKQFKIESVQLMSEKTLSPAIYVKYEDGRVERTIFMDMTDYVKYLTQELAKIRDSKLDKI